MTRFADNEYREKAGSEQNVAGGWMNKTRELDETNLLEGGLNVSLKVWEVHGDDHVDCKDVIRSHMRKSHGVIVVYDVMDEKTFKSVE